MTRRQEGTVSVLDDDCTSASAADNAAGVIVEGSDASVGSAGATSRAGEGGGGRTTTTGYIDDVALGSPSDSTSDPSSRLGVASELPEAPYPEATCCSSAERSSVDGRA